MLPATFPAWPVGYTSQMQCYNVLPIGLSIDRRMASCRCHLECTAGTAWAKSVNSLFVVRSTREAQSQLDGTCSTPRVGLMYIYC